MSHFCDTRDQIACVTKRFVPCFVSVIGRARDFFRACHRLNALLPCTRIKDVGSRKCAWGKRSFAKRDEILPYLNNGTLTLEIHLRKAEQLNSFVPSNPICDNILKGFNNDEMSDVTFEVGGEFESAPNRSKRTKTSATTFHANHVILRLNAPSLADMGRGRGAHQRRGTRVFQDAVVLLLRGNNRGGGTDRKLQGDHRGSRPFWNRQSQAPGRGRAHQADGNHGRQYAGQSLYANSKNLALFQEKIMDFVAENGDKIVGNVSFSTVPSELISDILTAFAQGKTSSGEAAAPEDDLKFMRVVELRKRLHDKGLCINGSRETMIALLSENSASN